MAKRSKAETDVLSNSGEVPKRTDRMRPALDPEVRENQMIHLAVNLAEKQLREGTAKSQVIVHYLKLGSTKEKLEKEILEKQKALMDAKTAAISSQQRTEEMIEKALAAMKRYSRGGDFDDD